LICKEKKKKKTTEALGPIPEVVSIVLCPSSNKNAMYIFSARISIPFQDLNSNTFNSSLAERKMLELFVAGEQ
jgi:hypothetical protein